MMQTIPTPIQAPLYAQPTIMVPQVPISVVRSNAIIILGVILLIISLSATGIGLMELNYNVHAIILLPTLTSVLFLISSMYAIYGGCNLQHRQQSIVSCLIIGVTAVILTTSDIYYNAESQQLRIITKVCKMLNKAQSSTDSGASKTFSSFLRCLDDAAIQALCALTIFSAILFLGILIMCCLKLCTCNDSIRNGKILHPVMNVIHQGPTVLPMNSHNH